eukprot:scaffold112622_cov35-Phaeocystis_antarctica.AAC.1
MIGSVRGRPFTSKMRHTAAVSNAWAPSPCPATSACAASSTDTAYRPALPGTAEAAGARMRLTRATAVRVVLARMTGSMHWVPRGPTTRAALVLLGPANNCRSGMLAAEAHHWTVVCSLKSCIRLSNSGWTTCKSEARACGTRAPYRQTERNPALKTT